MQKTLKIIISKEYKLQVKLIDSENKETIIKFSEEHSDEFYIPTISFQFQPFFPFTPSSPY